MEGSDLKISRSGKKKMSIKEVIENMDLDGIEWQKRIHVSISLLRFRSNPQNFGTETWLLLFCNVNDSQVSVVLF